MASKEPRTYVFSFKKKELIAIIASLIITYIMVFMLGVEVGKDFFGAEKQLLTEEITVPEQSSEKPIEPIEIPKLPPPPPVVEKPQPQEMQEMELPIKPVRKVKEKKGIPEPKIFIQAGAFSKKSYAESLAKRLKERGYKTEIRVMGGLYKVILGPYDTEEEAKKDLLKLKKNEEIYGYLIRL